MKKEVNTKKQKKEKQPLDPKQKKIMIALGIMAASMAVLGVVLSILSFYVF